MTRTRVASVCVLGLVASTLWVSTAYAGSYDVEACSNATGAAQNAFASFADRGLAAYSICPSTPSDPATGIVTRASATAGPGTVPYFAGAYQVFEAPPGAALESVTFNVAAIRLASYWTTGVITYDGDFNIGEYPYGCYAGNAGCAVGTRAFVGPVTANLAGHSKFRFETRCVNPGGCDISASGGQVGMRALFSAANVRVRVLDFTTPSVTPASGALFSGGWQRGVLSGFATEFDNVGVMINRTVVDGQVVYAEDFRDPTWPGWVHCDFTRARPCTDIPSPGALAQVNTRSLTDGTHELRVEAVDAAGNRGGAIRTIMVDNTPPARVNVLVEGGEGWRTRNGFTARWPTPPGKAAPVTTAHYRLCSTDAAPPRCTAGSRTATGIDGLADISVPAPGDYALSVWLQDQAGNVDEAQASDPVRLRFDDQPPNAYFEPLDDDDPTKLDVRVADPVSGVAGGVIEFRRAGWRQWHALRTSLQNGRLSARFDDLELPNETYELRVRVSDHAGNERTSYVREGGAPMTLTLPLRQSSRIVLRGTKSPKAKRCSRTRRGRARKRCRAKPPKLRNSGGSALLSGVLQTTAGRPLAGAPLTVFEEPRTGGGLRKVASVRSNGSGRFGKVLPDGPSRAVQIRYDGTPLIKPTLETVSIRVPARSTLGASRRFLHNGETVRLDGRLLGGPVPDGGKLIDLQAFYRGTWRTFATPRSDSDGRWSFRYTFEVTSGLVRYRFRARIRREAAYPYELGYSRVIAVTVRGA
jgi:hypothetical protein